MKQRLTTILSSTIAVLLLSGTVHAQSNSLIENNTPKRQNNFFSRFIIDKLTPPNFGLGKFDSEEKKFEKNIEYGTKSHSSVGNYNLNQGKQVATSKQTPTSVPMPLFDPEIDLVVGKNGKLQLRYDSPFR